MRIALYTAIVAVYLLLSSGMVLQLHYCMDQLAAIGLFHSDHRDVCEDCGMDMDADNDCCHDRTDVIKLVQDQTHAPAPVALQKPMLLAPNPDWSLLKPLNIQTSFHHSTTQPIDLLALQRYRYRLLDVYRI